MRIAPEPAQEVMLLILKLDIAVIKRSSACNPIRDASYTQCRESVKPWSRAAGRETAPSGKTK